MLPPFDVQIARIVDLLVALALLAAAQLGVTIWTLTHVRTPKSAHGPVK